MDRFAKVLLRLQESKQLRTVIFGASNTDRYMPGIHWGDILHLGLRYEYRKPCWVINSGANGNNTREALARFDRDVKSFSPDIVIVTLGGNDCDTRPEKFVPLQEYRKNLREIADRIHSVNAIAVFQTYYRMDIAAMEAERASGFLR
jgi:lysophospholipase L1-like esterase